MLRIESPLTVETEHLIHRVIGCSIAVHTELGSGYSERMYSLALGLEFDASGIAYEREKLITVSYRGTLIGHYRIDLVVGGILVVEVKCVERLASVHQSQVLGYMRASKLRAALLLNFKVGAMPDGIKRVVL